MEKIIKAVLILASVFIIVIIWVGIRNKPADLPKAKAKATSTSPMAGIPQPQGGMFKFGSDELKDIDKMLGEIERKRQGATDKEAIVLDRVREMLERAKAEQKGLAPAELLLPEQMPPGEPDQGEFPYSEMGWPERLPEEYPGEYPGEYPQEYPEP